MIDKLTFKEKLIQYCDIKEEIKRLEKRIERLRKQPDYVADVVQNGYKHHAVIRGYDRKREHKLDVLEDILQERHDTLLSIQIEVETFIDTIPKSDIRDIFTYRYIYNMKWFEIAQEMKLNGESVPRNRHDRYLEKIA